MGSFFSSITGFLSAPVQIFILICIVVVIRKFFFAKRKLPSDEKQRVKLPSMEKRDFTMEELRPYNGKDSKHILIAVNGKVFDVSKGHSFYGPDGPYSVFAGHDASRGLATFSIDESTIKEEYDDLSDLNTMQMESMMEWEMQFTEKYDYVGKLLKPGEKHTNYKAEESEDEIVKNENLKKQD